MPIYSYLKKTQRLKLEAIQMSFTRMALGSACRPHLDGVFQQKSAARNDGTEEKMGFTDGKVCN